MTAETAALSPALTARLAYAGLSRRWLDALSLVTPRTGRSGPIRRIGVLLQWGIGDAVLALPLLHALHDAWPDAAIELLGKPFLPDLMQGEPGIAAYHPLVPPWTRFSGKYRIWDAEWRRYGGELAALRRQPFDLLVAPRADPRDAVQIRLLRTREAAGFPAFGGRRWFTHDAGLPLKETLIAYRPRWAAALAQAVTGTPADPVPRFRRRLDGAVALARFRTHGYAAGPILAVSLGAGHPIRRSWDRAKVEAVLQTLQRDVGFLVLIEDPRGGAEKIDLPPSVPAMIWRSGLAELSAMLSVVDGVFCVDSGVMHMAAAVGRPVAAVFGPTSPALFGPPGGGHRVLAAPVMPCRPCFDACLYERPHCLDAITINATVVAVRQILAAPSIVPAASDQA